MNGWSAKDVTVGTALAYGESLTDTPVSKEYPITAGGALDCVVKISVSGSTVSSGITAKLQTAINDDWEDSKTVSISGDGNFYIKLLSAKAADQTYLPLLNKGRIVVTTGSGDALTVDAVEVLQEL